MPWKEKTLVGTTETPFHGNPAEAAPTPAEEDYLRTIFEHYFPGQRATLSGRFAGLRVLPAGSARFARRPRETLFVVDRPNSPRLVTIAGGKFTTYRSTALKALELLRAALPSAVRIAETADLSLRCPADSTPDARNETQSPLRQ